MRYAQAWYPRGDLRASGRDVRSSSRSRTPEHRGQIGAAVVFGSRGSEPDAATPNFPDEVRIRPLVVAALGDHLGHESQGLGRLTRLAPLFLHIRA